MRGRIHQRLFAAGPAARSSVAPAVPDVTHDLADGPAGRPPTLRVAS
jgi:hypothetical protein